MVAIVSLVRRGLPPPPPTPPPPPPLLLLLLLTPRLTPTGFIGGGLLPESKRGTKAAGVIAICDWWPTFASMAGLAPVDTGGPTPLDGVDQSGYIMRSEVPPRTEVVLDHLMHCVPGPGYDAKQCTRGQTPDFPAGHYRACA
jgi:hypothetical protein